MDLNCNLDYQYLCNQIFSRMQAALFLNGRLPHVKIIKKYIHKNTLIIAADGGANKIKKLKLIPKIITGDFDSISTATTKYYESKKINLIHSPDQNSTDFEKALKYLIKKNVKEVKVFGATGMRPDHTLNNFSVLKRFFKKINTVLITNEFEILYLPKSYSFNYKINETVSLIPMPIAAGIKTEGLEYELKNETLEFGKREGALNKSNSKKVSISFKSGNLLLFRKHFIKNLP